MLSVQNVSMHFGGIKAVDNITLSIKPVQLLA